MQNWALFSLSLKDAFLKAEIGLFKFQTFQQ